MVSHLGLGQMTDGESRGAELFLRERPEKVGLVLAVVASPPEEIATG